MTGRDERVLVERVRRTLAERGDGFDVGAPPRLPVDGAAASAGPGPAAARVAATAAFTATVAVVAVIALMAGGFEFGSPGEGAVKAIVVPAAGVGTGGGSVAVTTTVPVTLSIPLLGTAPTTAAVRTPTTTTVVARAAGPGPVPAGFAPAGVSFVSASVGWAVGGGAAVRTTDGGTSWERVGTVPAAVNGVAFVDTRRGWALGPALYGTEDGGATWAEVPVPGVGAGRATGIAARDGVAYLVAAAADDSGWRLYRAAAGAPSWTEVAGVTVGRRGSLGTPVLAGLGAAWVVGTNDGDGRAVAFATADGTTWERRDADLPCAWPVPAAGAAARGEVAVACMADDRQGTAVWVTRDGGRRFEKAADVGFPGWVWGVAVSGPTVVVTVWGPERALGRLYSSSDGGRTWALAGEGTGQRFGDLTFVTAEVGYARDDGGPGRSRLWMTSDGGRTWGPVAF